MAEILTLRDLILVRLGQSFDDAHSFARDTMIASWPVELQERFGVVCKDPPDVHRRIVGAKLTVYYKERERVRIAVKPKAYADDWVPTYTMHLKKRKAAFSIYCNVRTYHNSMVAFLGKTRKRGKHSGVLRVMHMNEGGPIALEPVAYDEGGEGDEEDHSMPDAEWVGGWH